MRLQTVPVTGSICYFRALHSAAFVFRRPLTMLLALLSLTTLHQQVRTSPTSGFAARFNAWHKAHKPQKDDVRNSVGPTASGTLSCAVCVVGQLARLELESKVRHSTLALAHIALAL